ncbi:uncharacterized protein LKV04_004531 [Tautogolabrus adspersus]
MLLTVLRVCGTLLAFSSLSWTMADSDEGDPLGDHQFGPCVATLRPEGPCRQGQDDSTCPYLFSLPPLTFHLPKQLRELESIVEDLQKLKDNVDQLRRMCEDCKVSQTERECGRQTERDHEKLSEGTDTFENEGMRNVSQECGTIRVKAERTMERDGDADSGKIAILEEKERKKWDTERGSDKIVIKDNEEEVAEKDGKTQMSGAKGKDKQGQAKVPMTSERERMGDIVRKQVLDKNRGTQRDISKEKDGKGDSKVDQEGLEKSKERRISITKNKKETEDRDHHMWRDETEKTGRKFHTEEDRGSDGIKMSEDRDEHTNKERKQHREERRKEMEKRIKVERNNEKPKQTESIGRAEKETIKEGEVEEDGETVTGIKKEGEKTAQSVERDGDGELASSKSTEGTDFVSISPTDSIISVALRHDSMDFNEAITIMSSLPSLPMSSSIPHLITDVDQDKTISADQLPTQSTGLGAGGIPDQQSSVTEAGIRSTSRPTTAATLSMPKSHKKSMPPVQRPTSNQRPQSVNVTGSHKDPVTDRHPPYVDVPKTQNSKPDKKLVHPSQTDKSDQNQKHHKEPDREEKTKPDLRSTFNQDFTPVNEPEKNLNSKSVPERFSEEEFKDTSLLKPPPRHRMPTTTTFKAGETPVKRPKPTFQLKPNPKTNTYLNPLDISGTTSDGIQNSQTNVPPASGGVKEMIELTNSPEDTDLKHKKQDENIMKAVTLHPKTSSSLETGSFPQLHTHSQGLTMAPNSRIPSDLRPQTASLPPSIPMSTRPNKIMRVIFQSVVPSTSIPHSSPVFTQPNQASHTESRLHVLETAPRPTTDPDKTVVSVPFPIAQTTSTTSPEPRSTTPATSGPEPLTSESSTPSARELRVKINQVAAFLNNSLSPNKRPPDRRPKQLPEDSSEPDRTDSKQPTLLASKAVTMMKRDCSDHMLRGKTKSGVYLVTPDLRSRSFPVFCDMELEGGGWTLLQRRHDGSVSFNRTWAEYRSGFGELNGGEFWLGNNMIHLLTRDRDMVLRVELEDFDGVMEFAKYEHFRVASERMRYRLSVGGYSGTAGDALRFSKTYDHHNRAFTTPDRDHDRYPSGNCGAYYSSGWWFDACMAANLNGRYYVGRYKGVRDGIFWGTWHNISAEYYPTNDRQSFKAVRMMIRPKGFAS